MNENVRPLIGDLFASTAQTLVNTVNTVGIMGKGIALEFKKRYPDMHREYVRLCERGEVELGRPYLWTSMFDHWVLNFPTKDHWRSRSKLSDIVEGLIHLERRYEEWGITSLAVPPLGCGEGGLEWRVVGPTLFRHLSRLKVPVELYAPFGTPPEQLEPSFLAGDGDASAGEPDASLKVSPASVALVEILARIHEEQYHWPTGRVSFQKIAYFATQGGIPTGLDYIQGSFGPFAPKLKQVQSQLENNGLLVERRMGRAFLASPGPTFADARRVYAPYISQWGDAIERVTDLLLRFDSQKMEVAASAHYAAMMLDQPDHETSEDDVLQYVLEWKKRRHPPLRPDDVATAVRHLNALGWIRVEPSSSLPLPAAEETAFA